MENLGYYNGKYGLIEEMSVPMLDRGCYFGDGVYDATYSANHIIYCLDEHIDRFYNSAKLFGIKISQTKSEMKELLYEMVKKVDSGEQFVYWQVTRGTGIRNHSFPDGYGNIWIMLREAKVQDTYKKIKLITLDDTRFFHCNVKSINLIPSVVAAEMTAQSNCDEAVFHRGERVTECAHSNVSIIKNGEFKTAQADNLILPGIARANLIKTCKKLNIAVDENYFTIDEMFDADEIIVSSSGSFCLAAEEIDGKKVGGKAPELLKQIQDALVSDFQKNTAK